MPISLLNLRIRRLGLNTQRGIQFGFRNHVVGLGECALRFVRCGLLSVALILGSVVN